MEYLEAKISQIATVGPEKQKTFIRSFATKPAKTLAGQSGKIFGLIEIASTDQNVPKLIDLIIEEIKNNYYRQKTASADNQEEAVTIEEKFEAVLKKTNLAIASFLESEQISLNLEKVNIIIAVILNQELHFALVGNVGVILFYNISRDNYRIINILESSKSQTATPDPIRLFSQVISGHLKPRDVLFLTTTNVLDYFSLERIKNILTHKLPAEGIIELKELLEQIESKENFGALALELEKAPVVIKKSVPPQDFDYRQAAFKDSMRELIKTEKDTAKLLTPSIMPEIKKYANSFKTGFGNYLTNIRSGASKIYQKKPVIRAKINIHPNIHPNFHLSNKLKTAEKFLPPIKKSAGLAILSLKKIITTAKDSPIWGKLSILLTRLFGNLIKKYKQLPPSSRILLVIVLILAVLFSQSIIWLGIKNQKEKRLEFFNQTIVDVETNKNDAEASLIYRDESLARQKLVEAKNLLAALKPETNAQKEQINLLTKGIEEQLQKLRHMVEITEPMQIINFSNLDTQAKIAPLMLLNQKNIYTQNYNNQSLYKANLSTRILSAIYSPTANTGNLKLGISINNEMLFFNESMSAFQLNPANDTLQTITININDNANIIDITTYNNRLYLLDSKSSQIYRYTKAGNGYGSSANWITEAGIDLSNAKSLTIDGSIYLIKSDGQIIKLENGKTADWQAKLIDPPLQGPTKIRTTDASNYLYILDPPTKRLVVLDKAGNLINQYTSPSFDDLKNFIVIEKEKQIYLLNGSAVFGIPTEHLK